MYKKNINLELTPAQAESLDFFLGYVILMLDEHLSRSPIVRNVFGFDEPVLVQLLEKLRCCHE